MIQNTTNMTYKILKMLGIKNALPRKALTNDNIKVGALIPIRN